MTNREREVLKLIESNPMISQEEIASILGITRSSVAVHISNLMKKGVEISFFEPIHSRSLLPEYFLFKKDCVMLPPELLLSIPSFRRNGTRFSQKVNILNGEFAWLSFSSETGNSRIRRSADRSDRAVQRQHQRIVHKIGPIPDRPDQVQHEPCARLGLNRLDADKRAFTHTQRFLLHRQRCVGEIQRDSCRVGNRKGMGLDGLARHFHRQLHPAPRQPCVSYVLDDMLFCISGRGRIRQHTVGEHQRYE